MPAPRTVPASRGTAVGCHLCEALNRVDDASVANRCWRCHSPLETADVRSAPRELARQRMGTVLALVVSALLGLVVALALPMVSLELNGQRSTVTLGSAAVHLWSQGRLVLSAALFLTTVLAPGIELGAMLVAVLALHDRARSPSHGGGPGPHWLVVALHGWQGMREWNMTEVLVLGTGVALVKLGQLATLQIGPGLAALMAFMALRVAAHRMLTPAQAWSLVGTEPPARRPPARVA